MTRKLAALLVAGLVFAPAASAKGPHAVLTSGPEAVEAGRPWVATIEFNEFPRQPHPPSWPRRGDRRVTAQLQPGAGQHGRRGRLQAAMVLPDGGPLAARRGRGEAPLRLPRARRGERQRAAGLRGLPEGQRRRAPGRRWACGPRARRRRERTRHPAAARDSLACRAVARPRWPAAMDPRARDRARRGGSLALPLRVGRRG